MSIASAVGQVIFSQKSGVYMPLIQSNQGDLYQEYQGEAANPSNIAPDFTSMLPVLSFILTSSRVAEGLVTPSSVKWYFNDTELSFTSNVSTNSFNGETGHFQFLPYTSNGGYYGLKILKNLVKASGAAACTIKAVATVTIGNTADEIQFVYNIPITKGVGMQQHVTIVAGDNNFFTLTEKNTSCVLKAVTRLGADEVTSGLTYAWFKQLNGAWSSLGVTSQSLTVTNDMVDTTGTFKVEVSKGSTLVGQDIQTVVDVSDPYDIIVGAVKTSSSGSTVNNEEVISDINDVITYTPKVVKRGTTNTPSEMADMKFYFVFMNSVGIVMNSDDYTTVKASKSVNYEMCSNAGGNLTYTITTAQ